MSYKEGLGATLDISDAKLYQGLSTFCLVETAMAFELNIPLTDLV